MSAARLIAAFVGACLLYLAAGFLISLELGWHLGSAWQWGWMPVEFIGGLILGCWGGSRIARRFMS